MVPRLSIVIPTHDTLGLTLECLASLPEDPAIEVILVDDGSRDGTATQVAIRFPTVQILRHGVALGFSGAANAGIRVARGDRILLLNSDTVLLPGSLAAFEEALASDEKLGILGAALQNSDGTAQWSGGGEPTPAWLGLMTSGLLPWLSRWKLIRRIRGFFSLLRDPLGPILPVTWVSGAAMLMRREVIQSLRKNDDFGRIFDEEFGFYGQDLDLCLRVRRQGWLIGIALAAAVLHVGGATIVKESGAIRGLEQVKGSGWRRFFGESTKARSARSSLGGTHPELLWLDLLRCIAREGGVESFRRARACMVRGAQLRLLARALTRFFRLPPARLEFDAVTALYARALAKIEAFDPARTSA